MFMQFASAVVTLTCTVCHVSVWSRLLHDGVYVHACLCVCVCHAKKPVSLKACRTGLKCGFKKSSVFLSFRDVASWASAYPTWPLTWVTSFFVCKWADSGGFNISSRTMMMMTLKMMMPFYKERQKIDRIWRIDLFYYRFSIFSFLLHFHALYGLFRM